MRILTTATAVLVAISCGFLASAAGAAQAAGDDDGTEDPGDKDTDSGLTGDAWAHLDPAPQNTFCDGFPDHKFKRSEPWNNFMFSDGSTNWQIPEMTPFASVPLYRQYSVFCDPKPDSDGVVERLQTVWYPYITADSTAYQYDLIAEVEAKLEPATIKWLNMDRDYDWLWVRVEHSFTIDDIPPIEAEAKATNDALGVSAHAWIRARPIEFTIDVPGVDGTKGVTSCDLATVTSEGGCPITFTHASVIDPTGEFTINTTLTYVVESNSGKYEGVTFTRDGTETITVAEAMAVSIDS